MDSMRRQVAEKMGFYVDRLGSTCYSLIAPDPHFSRLFVSSEDTAWDCLPPLDTWEGVGLVLKWLADHAPNFNIDISSFVTITMPGVSGSTKLTMGQEELPSALCGLALSLCKED